MLFRPDQSDDDATSLPPGWRGGELEPLFPALARATACFAVAGAGGCGDRTLVSVSGNAAQPAVSQPWILPQPKLRGKEKKQGEGKVKSTASI